MNEKQYKDLVQYATVLCRNKYGIDSHIEPSDIVAESFCELSDKLDEIGFLEMMRKSIKRHFYNEVNGNITKVDNGVSIRYSKCSMCKQTLPETEFYLYKNKETGTKTEIPGFCKKCVRIYMDNFRRTDAGKEANKRRVAKHVKKNRDKWNEYLRKRYEEDKKNLTDQFIKKRIRSKLKVEEITEEMIKEMRSKLIEKRNRKVYKLT